MPKHFIKNWRPISLLNVSYKLASSCIAARIKTVLDQLISTCQTGFVPSRFIGDNIRLIYDIIEHTNEQNIPGLLLLIDFEKAFDSISWEFIFQVLEIFNLGDDLIKWVALFHHNIKTAVIQNGFLSDFFRISRGCRQGDPVSPYIFLLCAEILAILIKKNTKIKGITIGETEFKVSQYADDTCLILDGSENSLNEALTVLKYFEDLSGLKVNIAKTKSVWIGCQKYCGETFNHRFKLDWDQSDFNHLGIIFSPSVNNMVELNFQPVLRQIHLELEQWSKRFLTPLGRITVLKTLIISKFTHLFTSLPNPSETYIKELEICFFNFIWQSKTDRVKRDVMVQNYCDGGLKND